MNQFYKLLKDSGLKVTPQRSAILEVLEKEGHISVEKIFETLKHSFPSLSLATIYKNMITLQEYGIVKELKISGHKNNYEIVQEDHHHIVCQKCGKISDVHIDMDNSLKEISIKYNFEIINTALAITGICKTC